MKILVINAGSSSLKYQLLDMADESVIAKGVCERIGIDGNITHVVGSKKIPMDVAFPTHKEAFMKVVELITTGEDKVVNDVKEIGAVGHRVLHGAEVYKVSTLIDDKVIQTVEDLSDLGPLHNPPQVAAMRACREVFGDVPMVAVFDTSFHQTMPEKAYMYGIPYEYYEKYHIRKYGFHGTSHRYVSSHFIEEHCGGKAEGTKIIVCHLGNGSSICAVKDGKCFDTSMGFTPLDGLMMGTRSGSIDPSILFYLSEKEGVSPQEMNDILNKKSGFLGVSGLSSDSRDLNNASQAGNDRAKLVVSLFRYQIKKYIGSYAAAMGGVTAVLFTGGIGENVGDLRAEVLEELDFMGLEIDPVKNATNTGADNCLSKDNSKASIWTIPTNEELMIARDTLGFVK